MFLRSLHITETQFSILYFLLRSGIASIMPSERMVQLYPDTKSDIFSYNRADISIRAHVGSFLWRKHVNDAKDIHLCLDISHGAALRESKEDRTVYCDLKILLIKHFQDRPSTGHSERSISEEDLRISPVILGSFIKTIVRSPEPSSEETHHTTSFGLTADLSSHGTAEVSHEKQVSQHVSHTAKAIVTHDRGMARIDMHESPVSQRGIPKRVIVAIQFQEPPQGLYKLHYELVTKRRSESMTKQWRRWMTRNFGRTVYATHDENHSIGTLTKVRPVLLDFEPVID